MMNMSEYFHSAEKIRTRYTQSEKKVAKNVQSMDCVQLSLSEKKLKDREKAQPVRIIELLGYSEKTKSCPRESVRKRLPERLNHGEKDINSNQGKQEHGKAKNSRLTINARRKLYLTETAPIYNGKNEDTVSTANNSNSCVVSSMRSNLRYSTYNINNGKKNVNDNTNRLLNEQSGTKNKRKSFLLPPNSIKNKHIVTESDKEQLNLKNKETKSKDVFRGFKSTELNGDLCMGKFIKDNTDPSEVNENSNSGHNKNQDKSIFEISQEVEKGGLEKIQEDKETSPKSSPVQKNIDLDRPSVIVKPDLTTKTNVPSKLHSIIETEGLGNNHFPLQQVNSLKPKKNSHTENTLLENKLEKNTLSLSNTKENFQEQVHVMSRQESRLSINDNVNKLCIDEKDIIYMKSNLEGLICETEEKLFNLKEMLKHVNKILDSSKNNEHKETSKKDDFTQNSHCTLEREERNTILEKQETLEENSDTETEKDSSKEYIQPTINEDNIFVEEIEMVKNDKYAFVPSDLPEQNNVDEYLDLTIGNEEKENLQMVSVVSGRDEMQNQDTRKYFGTPKQIQSMYNKDDSFLNLEDQLNIIHVKALSNSSCLVITPVKRKSKWHEKPLQEYMMLKSSISFLQTPDAKRFQSKTNQNDENAVSNTLKTCISRKLLTELRDLCTDSPS